MNNLEKSVDFLNWLEASNSHYGYPYWNDKNHIFYGNRNMNAPQNDPTMVNSPTQQVSQRVDQLWQLYQSIDNRLSAIEKMKSAVQR